MAAEDRENIGITESQYNQAVSERVMPGDVKLFFNYVFRMLLPTRHAPPFAIETFGTVLNIEHEAGEAWEQLVSLDGDRPKGIIILPMASDGFVVTPNVGPTMDETRPDGFIQIGYLLGRTSLTDIELTQFAETPVTSNI